MQSSNYMTEKTEKEDGVGVPHIFIEINDKAEIDLIYKNPKLPLVEEVLDGMGMGPKGPPIPPPAIFSVVPYPVHRKSPPGAEFSHYVFVTTNENDPYDIF
jgi:hydrocephalus-inducing protein